MVVSIFAIEVLCTGLFTVTGEGIICFGAALSKNEGYATHSL